MYTSFCIWITPHNYTPTDWLKTPKSIRLYDLYALTVCSCMCLMGCIMLYHCIIVRSAGGIPCHEFRRCPVGIGAGAAPERLDERKPCSSCNHLQATCVRGCNPHYSIINSNNNSTNHNTCKNISNSDNNNSNNNSNSDNNNRTRSTLFACAGPKVFQKPAHCDTLITRNVQAHSQWYGLPHTGSMLLVLTV